MSVVISILTMLLMLSILTIVHEFGHYIAGRIFKVKILEFSVFMGPKIFSKTSRKTGIKYSLRWLPIGGYCAFEGEEETESSDSFSAKPWYVRAIILVAGAFMNILLALIVVIIIFSVSGYTTTKVVSVNSDYAIGFTDLEPGDKIVKYDGKYLFSTDDYSLFHEYDKDNVMNLTVRKKDGGKVKYVFATDYSVEGEGEAANVRITVAEDGGKKKEDVPIGVFIGKQTANHMDLTMEYADGTAVRRDYDYTFNNETGYAENCTLSVTETRADGTSDTYSETVSDYEATERLYAFTKYGFGFEVGKGGFFKIIGESFKYLFTLTRSIYYSLYWLITGNVGLDAVMGPVGLTSVVSDVVKADAAFGNKLLVLLNFIALIGVNLGVFNLLPFPALDGGKLFLILIELIRGGKKIDPEKEGIISLIGFAVLILLAIFIAGKDIVSLIKR